MRLKKPPLHYTFTHEDGIYEDESVPVRLCRVLGCWGRGRGRDVRGSGRGALEEFPVGPRRRRLDEPSVAKAQRLL